MRDAVVREDRARVIARRAARAPTHMSRCPRHCRFRQVPRSFGWRAAVTSKPSRHNSGSITSSRRAARALSRSRDTAGPSVDGSRRPARSQRDDGHDRRSPLPEGQVVRPSTGPVGRTSTAGRGGGGHTCGAPFESGAQKLDVGNEADDLPLDRFCRRRAPATPSRPGRRCVRAARRGSRRRRIQERP